MLTALLLGATIAMSQDNTPKLAPLAPVPSARQLEWHKLEYYAFVHFGPNTFAGQEWGHGTEDPNSFNPTQLDARQWVKTFKDAGMKQVIITAKHHDGFCLFPSAYSKHTVAQSKWRNGKGDVLADLRKACDEFGLKMGVYLSPWDRNHPAYGTPEYNQVFANTLKEVLTKYGPIYEVWFDGANGEGPNGKKQVYDWPLFIKTVRDYAPKAVIFSDAGPDLRWVGNEAGHSAPTCWSMVKGDRYTVGTPLYAELTEGSRDGDAWRPAECDVSIRPGWFYHKDQDDKVKTPAQLLDLYERSVGQNGSFLLNVPPDQRGLIHENDVKALMEFKKLREATYATRAAIPTRTTNGALTDGNDETYWASGTTGKASIHFPRPSLFDRVLVREPIEFGQRVEAFTLWATVDGKRVELAKGTTIGAKRIVRVPATMATDLEIEITKSRGPVGLSALQIHASPDAAVDYRLSRLQDDKDKRMAWWREARYGMFIHWGLYSVPAGEWKGKMYGGASEWLMNTAQIPVADYKPLQAQFNPTKYDAKRWVQIAKAAGMKYIVITSKHHDGFGLWDSKLTDWDVMGSPFKRDILKELAQACKEGGIKLCFYHSIMDWTHPDYGLRRPWDLRKEIPTNMDRYTQYMKGQLKELLTNYGDIGILWFDGEWEPEAWNHERGKDLYAYVRSLQPNIIVNNRVDVFRSGMAGMSSSDKAFGDYGTPEQEIPANGLPGLDWESCMTMNGSWGFHKGDTNWKSAETLVKNLIDCASKGGNYLLNVGPTSLGEIPEASVERLIKVGKWLDVYGESIYGTHAGPFPKALPWGRATARKGVVYCQVLDPKTTEIELTGWTGKIKRISQMGSDTGGSLMIRSGEHGPVIPVRQTERDPAIASMPRVIVLEVEGDVKVELPPLPQNADGSILLGAIDAMVDGGAHYEDAPDKKAIGFWTNASDVVSWSFQASKLGTYNVELEVACSADSAGAEFEVNVGGVTLKGVVPNTGSWSTFVKLKLGKAAIVTPGMTKVTVKATKKPGYGVMNLRSVSLKP